LNILEGDYKGDRRSGLRLVWAKWNMLVPVLQGVQELLTQSNFRGEKKPGRKRSGVRHHREKQRNRYIRGRDATFGRLKFRVAEL